MCRANGNPAPLVTITGTDGVEIPVSSAQAIAVRDDSVQYILCTAENNDEDSDFAAGEAVQAQKELDVYCKYNSQSLYLEWYFTKNYHSHL